MTSRKGEINPVFPGPLSDINAASTIRVDDPNYGTIFVASWNFLSVISHRGLCRRWATRLSPLFVQPTAGNQPIEEGLQKAVYIFATAPKRGPEQGSPLEIMLGRSTGSRGGNSSGGAVDNLALIHLVT